LVQSQIHLEEQGLMQIKRKAQEVQKQGQEEQAVRKIQMQQPLQLIMQMPWLLHQKELLPTKSLQEALAAQKNLPNLLQKMLNSRALNLPFPTRSNPPIQQEIK
jgi:hypothetical protein